MVLPFKSIKSKSKTGLYYFYWKKKKKKTEEID